MPYRQQIRKRLSPPCFIRIGDGSFSKEKTLELILTEESQGSITMLVQLGYFIMIGIL